MAGRSVMQHSFSEVPRAQIQRSSFRRNNGLKTTFDADYLIPIMVDDIVPGDTFNVECNFFARLATPLHPIMDVMYLETFWFFVPYRLLWDNWEKMHGAQDDPGDSIDFTVPKYGSSAARDMTAAGGSRDLWNYMGLPYHANVNEGHFSALPFRAYYLIWDEWFRDQNLQDSTKTTYGWTTGNGPDGGVNDYTLLKRGKRHDYFTSCLPWPQKGDAVSLPLGTSAPVTGIGNDGTAFGVASVSAWETDASASRVYASGARLDTETWYAEEDPNNAGFPNIRADLSTATAATINDLRLAFQTQRLLERDARSGTRYNELILSHFGVTVPDFRVQRPEFLGGGSSPVNVNAVANTSPVDSTNAPQGADVNQGDLAAFGTVSGSHGFTKSFVEHGILIGLANVRGDITYSQGAERYWFKETRYDFYYPVLAQIGEQAVENREIWYNNDANDQLVFGYQERYAEYRYKPSRLTGLFRVDHASTLAAWHLSEDFATLPSLGSTFIESNTGTPLDRAIAVNTEPHFIADFYFKMNCARPMPLHGVPGNLDHF